jgi:hypothetical protein
VFVELMLEVIETDLVQNSEAFSRATDQVSDQVSDQVKKLLEVMGNEYWTVQEMIVQLGLSHKPTFRKNYLNPALAEGLVAMKYPESPRSQK